MLSVMRQTFSAKKERGIIEKSMAQYGAIIIVGSILSLDGLIKYVVSAADNFINNSKELEKHSIKIMSVKTYDGTKLITFGIDKPAGILL